MIPPLPPPFILRPDNSACLRNPYKDSCVYISPSQEGLFSGKWESADHKSHVINYVNRTVPEREHNAQFQECTHTKRHWPGFAFYALARVHSFCACSCRWCKESLEEKMGPSGSLACQRVGGFVWQVQNDRYLQLTARNCLKHYIPAKCYYYPRLLSIREIFAIQLLLKQIKLSVQKVAEPLPSSRMQPNV